MQQQPSINSPFGDVRHEGEFDLVMAHEVEHKEAKSDGDKSDGGKQSDET